MGNTHFGDLFKLFKAQVAKVTLQWAMGSNPAVL